MEKQVRANARLKRAQCIERNAALVHSAQLTFTVLIKVVVSKLHLFQLHPAQGLSLLASLTQSAVDPAIL